MARIDAASIRAAAPDVVAWGGVDGVFLSCSNLRSLDVIPDLAAQTSLPVLSDTFVLTRHLAQLAETRDFARPD